MSSYDLTPMKAPRATGGLLRLLATLLENPLTAGLLVPKLLRDAGVTKLRETPTEEALPATHALQQGAPTPPEAAASVPDLAALSQSAPSSSGFRFETVADFAAAYRNGTLSPEDVALRVLEQSQRNDRRSPPMRSFIAQDAQDVLTQAQASAARFRAGAPLSLLDGVPVSVKDELDQAGYPTTVGTRFLGGRAATLDATSVARVRAAGAILIGKANMHEIGIGVTGNNLHHGAARNPYEPNHATGGSSSGSAASVAAGLCPLSIGADGGGSIRIPAAFCGVVGLKATFGRVSETGAAPLCWSVAHIGPIGATVRDVALGYALMSGRDASDANTFYQPAPTLDGFNADLRGIKLGVFWPWFEDAAPSIVSACRRVLEGLKEAGAELVEIDIPNLALLRAVHLVTILSEMAAAHDRYYKERRPAYAHDTRINLALARQLRGYDYVLAQRHRAEIFRNFSETLSRVDAIVTPTTARTAPRLSPEALAYGESDIENADQTMRYALAANLTGLPAISFPAGYDEHHLPIGFQAMGRAWDEALLLRIARVGELIVPRRAPQVYHPLLR